jgi:hypothetical protein
LVAHSEERTQAEDFREKSGEENIWNKKNVVRGEWRRLQNEELHALYSSLNIIRVIKSTRIRWEGHVAGMKTGRAEVHTRYRWGNLR